MTSFERTEPKPKISGSNSFSHLCMISPAFRHKYWCNKPDFFYKHCFLCRSAKNSQLSSIFYNQAFEFYLNTPSALRRCLIESTSNEPTYLRKVNNNFEDNAGLMHQAILRIYARYSLLISTKNPNILLELNFLRILIMVSRDISSDVQFIQWFVRSTISTPCCVTHNIIRKLVLKSQLTFSHHAD